VLAVIYRWQKKTVCLEKNAGLFVAPNVHPEGGLREADLAALAHGASVLQLQVQRGYVILQVVLHLELFAALNAAPVRRTVHVESLRHLPVDEVLEF